MSLDGQARTNRINGLAALAGITYGAFLSGQFFGGSWIALGLGAFIGLAILSPTFAQMASISAGALMGMSGIGYTWTEHHEKQAQHITEILLMLITLSGIIGLIFAPSDSFMK